MLGQTCVPVAVASEARAATVDGCSISRPCACRLHSGRWRRCSVLTRHGKAPASRVLHTPIWLLWPLGLMGARLDTICSPPVALRETQSASVLLVVQRAALLQHADLLEPGGAHYTAPPPVTRHRPLLIDQEPPRSRLICIRLAASETYLIQASRIAVGD
jgi:hypothetical protein